MLISISVNLHGRKIQIGASSIPLPEEIWKYFKHVSTKYDLKKYVRFNTKVETATWDEGVGIWMLFIVAEDGSQFEDWCEILINGSGVLKYSPVPAINM